MRFLRLIGGRRGTAYRVSPEAMSALVNYAWPGNLRELQNALEFATHLCDSGEVRLEHLPQVICSGSFSREDRVAVRKPSFGETEATPISGLRSELAQHDRAAVVRALRATGWSVAGKRAAAKMLGISLASLYNRIKQHGITKLEVEQGL